MQIDFANLKIQHNLYKEEIEEAILKVARDCNFIMGSQIDELERNLEKFTGSKYAISCSSGTDGFFSGSTDPSQASTGLPAGRPDGENRHTGRHTAGLGRSGSGTGAVHQNR